MRGKLSVVAAFAARATLMVPHLLLHRRHQRDREAHPRRFFTEATETPLEKTSRRVQLAQCGAHSWLSLRSAAKSR